MGRYGKQKQTVPAHLDIKEGLKLVFKNIDIHNCEEINAFLIKHWYTTTMVIRKKEFDLKKADGIFCCDGDNIIGLVTYIIRGENDSIKNDICEILSLDSLTENKGIGTEPIEKVKKTAKERNCKKLVLITTNDNLHALKFYQKRNFSISRLFVGYVTYARRIKPQIPMLGNDDIPIKDEIELEMEL